MRDIKITQSITNTRNEDSLNRYLSDIGQICLLTGEEEVLLAKKIRAGDKAAEHMLIIANLRFVVSVAKKYQMPGMPLQDLVNEGNIGLIKAARKFDETKGFKFISYAVWWIRQSIIHAIGEYSRSVRLPMNQQMGINSVKQESIRLEQRLEREPTLEELEEVLGKPVAQLAEFIQYGSRMRYLDDELPGSVSESNTLIDHVPHEESNLINKHIKSDGMSSILSVLLEKLSEREKKILILGYGLYGQESLTHDTIAVMLDLSKERIRQITESAIKKLQLLPKTEYIKEFIE
ncbi:MAG TPA: RNA polymerase sigma factor RpoD/SigA [Pedobacter sp.]|nr:RNA polymerase sigma factor RpoD/SigA [Pedobacter sp.]